MSPWKYSASHSEFLKSCSQPAPSLPTVHTNPSTAAKPLLGPGGCGGGSWACVVSVLHLGLALCASNELHSVLGQDSSALFPLCKFCPQSLAGPFCWGGFLLSNLAGVSVEPKSCFDSLALLDCSSNSTQFYKPHKSSCACYSDS